MSWETGSDPGAASCWLCETAQAVTKWCCLLWKAREDAKDFCDENAVKWEEHAEARKVTEDVDLGGAVLG